MKPEILYVDDEIENLKVFKRIFKKDFEIHTALSGEEGLKIFESNKDNISVIISDQRMPGMSGVDFLNACKLISKEEIRIIITGYADLESTINAINEAEIYRFVTKPWESLDLKQTLNEAHKKYELKKELDLKNKELTEANLRLLSIDELKNKFMMLVNHELKTPVTIQKSFLELLKETNLNEEQNLFLDKAKAGTEKLEKLVEEILFLLKIETSSLKDSKQSFKAKDSLKELFSFDAKIDFVESKPIKTNTEYFKEALKRVLENADQHKKTDSEVEIKCEGDTITISNEIDPKKAPALHKIIEPFEIDEDPFHHTKGLGLGLSVALLIFKKLQIKTDLNIDKKFTVRINV